jgi:hypothetical protein
MKNTITNTIKKSYLIILSTFFLNNVYSQQQSIPNFSFEDWTTVSGFDFPNDWSIYDSISVVAQKSLKRQSGGSEGNSSLYLGYYSGSASDLGTSVYIEDYLTSTPSGLSVDYYTEIGSMFQYGGFVFLTEFFDLSNNLILTSNSGRLNRQNSFGRFTVGFNFNGAVPAKYKLHLINNYENGLNKYSVVDNVKFLFSSSSVNEIKNTYLSIFPNPSNGIVSINSNQDIANINVFDITGKAVLNQEYTNKLNQAEIDLSALNNGIYFIAVQSSNGEISKSKIVLAK